MSKTIEQALDKVVVDIKAKQKQNARRLAKIHKLKQENRMLAIRRNSLMDKRLLRYQLTGRFQGLICIDIQ